MSGEGAETAGAAGLVEGVAVFLLKLKGAVGLDATEMVAVAAAVGAGVLDC